MVYTSQQIKTRVNHKRPRILLKVIRIPRILRTISMRRSNSSCTFVCCSVSALHVVFACFLKRAGLLRKREVVMAMDILLFMFFKIGQTKVVLFH